MPSMNKFKSPNSHNFCLIFLPNIIKLEKKRKKIGDSENYILNLHLYRNVGNEHS